METQAHTGSVIFLTSHSRLLAELSTLFSLAQWSSDFSKDHNQLEDLLKHRLWAWPRVSGSKNLNGL